ncbi:hypothetical protein Q8A73_002891 [Channa argus]|nr:hypothetical protein Q8A73_002891 [Channa argus]
MFSPAIHQEAGHRGIPKLQKHVIEAMGGCGLKRQRSPTQPHHTGGPKEGEVCKLPGFQTLSSRQLVFPVCQACVQGAQTLVTNCVELGLKLDIRQMEGPSCGRHTVRGPSVDPCETVETYILPLVEAKTCQYQPSHFTHRVLF